MEEKILTLFLKVRESFDDIKEKVSLIKPYFELLVFSTGWALKIGEFERLLGFKPEFIYKSNEEVYAISVLYRIDDDITTGIIAHEFAEIVAKEKNILKHELIDGICVERGFGEQLLYALQNDILPGTVERDFIDRDDLERRIENLKRMCKVKKC
ncbi:MAG: hypothetical protein OEW23_19605 [Candidatus Aminicenantes bacterium]|nr:hypothetical protein [Candidatus Aminicenantes bacterium]